MDTLNFLGVPMKKILLMTLIISITINTIACTPKEKKYTGSFLLLFNTFTEVMGYAKNEQDFKEFSQLIYDNLDVYHKLYDKYNNYDNINNIKTINDNAGIKPVKVDKKIIDLLIFSKEMYQLTDGTVNIAMGSVLEIWHNYREEGIDNPLNSELPPLNLLNAANLHTDINNVIIDEVNSTVFLNDEKMALDVGAIAKGYATEMVAQATKDAGYNNFLLSVGGNVRAVGQKGTESEFWNIGVRNPDGDTKSKPLYTLNINNLSLVSSGDYERYYTVKGERYHHIINPSTLMPANYFTAVSILCEDSGLADSLSTAIFNMNLEDGQEFIENLEGVEALWILKNGKEVFSSGFKSYIKKM